APDADAGIDAPACPPGAFCDDFEANTLDRWEEKPDDGHIATVALSRTERRSGSSSLNVAVAALPPAGSGGAVRHWIPNVTDGVVAVDTDVDTLVGLGGWDAVAVGLPFAIGGPSASVFVDDVVIGTTPPVCD